MKSGYKILKKGSHGLCFFAFCFILFSCNTTKKLHENEYLLDENYIENNKTSVPSEEIMPFIRQQPNRYLVTIDALNIELFPYHLWLYNSIDQEKMMRIKQERDKKYDRINTKRIARNEIENQKRIAKGKKPKPAKLKDKTELTWRENWVQSGEPPSILDSAGIKTNCIQIRKFLHSKGYFQAQVTDSVHFRKHSRKAEVHYKINAGPPTQIRNIEYSVEGEQLSYYVFQDTVNCLIKRGMRYDVDVLTKERERISKQQRDNGYYKFGPEYVFLLVDTNVEGNLLDVEINIKKYAYRPEDNNDTLIISEHQRYTIDHIYVVTDYDIFNRNKTYNDTSRYHDDIFLYNKHLNYRKKDIVSKILFYQGQVFNYDIVEETFTRLSALKSFKNINITFKESETKPYNLDCYINMTPMFRQNFSIETEGTNTSGNFGAAANIVYQNRNTFRGSELLEIKLKGGLIAQKNFDSQQQNNTTSLGIPLLQAFNTVQFGPEVNLNFPKPLFPFTFIPFAYNAQPKTIIGSSLSFQQNNRYARTLSNISYGLQFNEKKYTKHFIVPVEVNVIKADLSSQFLNDLTLSRNLFLKNSFANHITTVSRYTYIFNTQTPQDKDQYKTFIYFKMNLESSGNILRGIYNLAGEKKDSEGRYRLFEVPFAQFLRSDLDFRVYRSVKKLGRFVFRAYGGMGYALDNLRTLPYEKSFFAGGPNSIRAWQARRVGPGSYDGTFIDSKGVKQEDANFDRLGDIQMEANFEFRFNIYKFLNGAWFVDAGNVWLRQKNPEKPNGEFDATRFYKELATGTGLGLRADFSFFIIRFDGAFQTYDPSRLEGDRWLFGKGMLKKFTVNFGIGYPF
ncbi:MAG: translocation and assembly module lipoprotein TamL [Bacteroidia bacterium]